MKPSEVIEARVQELRAEESRRSQPSTVGRRGELELRLQAIVEFLDAQQADEEELLKELDEASEEA